MNKVAKFSALIAVLLLIVTGVAVSRMQTLSAQTVEATLGQDYVSNTSTADNTILVTVVDSAAAGTVGSTTVTATITNLDTDATLTLTLTETSTATFHGTVSIVATTTSGSLLAADGEQIEAKYSTSGSSPLTLTGLTATGASYVVVDATGPTIANTAPADEAASRSQAQLFQAEISDSASGVGSAAADVKGNSTITVNGSGFAPVVTDLTDGLWRIQVGLNLAEGDHTWVVSASDELGNSTTGTTDELEIDLTPPGLSSAKTGDVATSDDPAAISADSDRNSIRVTFDDVLSSASIDSSDFRVLLDNVDLTVSSATWVTGANTEKQVFLTLANEMPADATPVVRIVGDIQDDALNTTSIGETTATDGLDPSITMTVTGTGTSVTSEVVTVRVDSDEASTAPTISTGLVVKAANDDGTDLTTLGTTQAATTFTTVTAGKAWEWEFTFDDATDKGSYNAYVSISDGTNSGTKGHATDPTDDDAILFEVDTAVAAVALTPSSSDDSGTFVNLAYTGEATEYIGDSHSTVTISSATVDAETVITNTVDSKTFTIASPAGGWALGEHELIVTAVDGAGNSSEETKTFTITERSALSIALNPGMNLVSLPGAPANTAINDVISATHPINQVLTYDPSVAGGWLVAERGDDGLFAGTLTTIGSNLAYFVRTTTFEPLEILIPRLSVGEQVLPPSISLEAGWNLVPVVDVSGDVAAGSSGGTVGNYLPSETVRVFGLDSFGNLASKASGDALNVGSGYWVYVSAATVLVP